MPTVGVMFAARQSPGRHRGAQPRRPGYCAGRRGQRVDDVVLGRHVDPATEHQWLAVQLPVQRRRRPRPGCRVHRTHPGRDSAARRIIVIHGPGRSPGRSRRVRRSQSRWRDDNAGCRAAEEARRSTQSKTPAHQQPLRPRAGHPAWPAASKRATGICISWASGWRFSGSPDAKRHPASRPRCSLRPSAASPALRPPGPPRGLPQTMAFSRGVARSIAEGIGRQIVGGPELASAFHLVPAWQRRAFAKKCL